MRRRISVTYEFRIPCIRVTRRIGAAALTNSLRCCHGQQIMLYLISMLACMLCKLYSIRSHTSELNNKYGTHRTGWTERLFRQIVMGREWILILSLALASLHGPKNSSDGATSNISLCLCEAYVHDRPTDPGRQDRRISNIDKGFDGGWCGGWRATKENLYIYLL